MKKKGAGMVMTIMLVAVCGWVAIVVFVIKPDIVAGAFLCIAGGIIIGLVIFWLMQRWWFTVGRWEERVHKKPKYDLGTRLVKVAGTFRYACAGEDLKQGTMVEASLAGRVLNGQGVTVGKELNELIYGDVKAAREVNKYGTSVLGWPLVNVTKGHFCWLQEPPMGAEFKKEGDGD